MSPFNAAAISLPRHTAAVMLRVRESAIPDAARVLIDEPGDYARVLAFWMEHYGLDAKYLHCDHRSVELYAYYRGGELVGTVAFRAAGDDEILHQRSPNLPPASDVIEISKLCIKKGHRDLMQRVCEDVHARLVLSGRTRLAIAAPRWLQKSYRFIGFQGTGVRFPIPGIADESLEIMISRQHRFGTYGLHTDPIRWNLFLRRVTDRLIATQTLRPSRWQRALIELYRFFAPIAAMFERRFLWRRT